MNSVTVTEAVESYLNDRESELSASSQQNHRYQLKQFKEWCERVHVDSIEEVEPIHISRFRRARSKDINSNTMYNQLSIVRLFLAFCERMMWVEPGVSESVVLPSRDGKARDRSIDVGRAHDILDRLEKYAYASIDHVLFSMFWSAGLRIGSLRSVDIDDIDFDERFVDLNHRPETHTPLKNGDKSEREVNLHGWVVELLDDFIHDRRIDSTDRFDRSSLITTDHGRAARSTIRKRVYRITDCAGLNPGCGCVSYQSKCSESVSPHDIRRSSITAWLNQGHEPSLLSDRFDVSERVISDHYDVRTEREKRELRRDAFDM